MEEKELIAIEQRMNDYPLEARQDIGELLGELRRVRNVPQAKRTDPALSHLYDPLTGLLNAGAYGVRFAMARARATRYRKIFAVMSLDFDPATLSDRGGGNRDARLKDVAARLQVCVRATDTLARIGEENFAIILEDLNEPGQAERVKQHVEETLAHTVGAKSGPPADIRLQFYPARATPAAARLS